MSNIFYSASKRAFFDTAVHSIDSIPEGSVEVSRESHKELLEGQGMGFDIVPDDEGFPKLVEPAKPSEEEQIQQANILIMRQIEALERDKQPRAMRDFLLGGDKTRLSELNVEIEELRAQLR